MLHICLLAIAKTHAVTPLTKAIGWTLVLTVSSLFALTQYRILSFESPQHRKMAPVLVWLTVIPYAGSIIQIYFIKQISNSISRQLSVDAESASTNPTFIAGFIYWCINMVFTIFYFIRLLTSISNTQVQQWVFRFWLISFIIYWVRLGVFKRRIQKAQIQNSFLAMQQQNAS